MSQVRPGLLIAFIVFAVFAAYAFLAPATYRSSALLVVESASPASSVNLPEPLEAARRLSEAVLDRSMLARLSSERAGSAAPDVQARAASSVRESLAIDTSDAHAFSISYKDNDRERAQRVCNELTHHAFERAPQVLLDRSRDTATDLKRQQQTQELAAFLTLHPQVASESAPTPGISPDKDPALSAFHAEKANLERRVLELESGAGSDNPYLDPAESDVKLLRRRLAEIDTALNARREALDSKPPTENLSPELRAEWRRLLDGVTRSGAGEPTQDRPALIARIVAEAPLPTAPIDPNRALLLFFGVVFGGGLGAAFTLVVRAAQQRRTKSSRPPSHTSPQGGLSVQLPGAPPLPSGLGPAVPPSPTPAAPRGPPIVPMQQRPISSSPPGPAPGTASNGFGNTLPIAKSEPVAVRGEVVRRPPSDPPAAGAPLRFASTIVLPPTENPSPIADTAPDPVLASAARAWDEQIRAHEVPGFAVVQPRSEPAPGRSSSSVPPPPAAAAKRANSSVPPPVAERRPGSSAPPPAATIQRTMSRPPNRMKVTQPLGSFLPDGVWNDPERGLVQSPTASSTDVAPAMLVEPPVPARSSMPQRSASPMPGASRYSYVSTPPPAAPEIVDAQPILRAWSPDPSLAPESQRVFCEQLYPFAVESCFVIGVVSVPESVEQKSRIAAEIALALADSGHPRVLLMEGDLHRPRVQRLAKVDMPMSGGFSQQLRNRINGQAPSRWTVMSCTKSLHVLAEGMMRSPGLLLSQQFADCLQDLRKYYDIIVIDGPTESLEIESRAIDAVIDGVVAVCPANGSAALARIQRLFGPKRFSGFIPVA
jgi:Mrp family chromosome partitioning ATPase/uncharacterized protein involved in exopolysaccharide biosynthesis